MNGAMTRRGTRGGSWRIKVPESLGVGWGTPSNRGTSTYENLGFRTFRNCKQPPHTKEYADDGHVP